MTTIGGMVVGLAIGGVLGFSAGLALALVVASALVPDTVRPKVVVDDYFPEAWLVTT